jgi:hypothetical protein
LVWIVHGVARFGQSVNARKRARREEEVHVGYGLDKLPTYKVAVKY